MLMRNILVIALLLFCKLSDAQSLQSPKQFLGYELGEKFTPHYKIADYFEAAAKAAPQQMKLEKYGETNEGRPLYIAVLSSPDNMGHIDEIRKNNLRLTGLLNDAAANTNDPAIVWLSYNVHGNEASSSEVSMKVLYEILSGQNTKLNDWLKNTVIIIDPCLNPDGRDRYVNWFNQMKGQEPNADPKSREHREPWPGGRVNHYNFDLNRDWVWQTQVESQQRLVVYQQWMPEIHCDFHEQYPDNPYYFAPAAEPVHPVITQWQKDFQVTVGKNHARYFDANGWLYFTKQYFDLFYPSYGDTYPLFNGAIGMTYEQAGHSVGGLAVALEDGDTLTLADRIAHHFTTSMSTIEVASGNREKLVTAFKKYFDDNRAGKVGLYKSYVISSGNENKIASLLDLFNKNEIEYGYAAEGKTMKGYNYFSGKEESFAVQKNDLVVSSSQPKAALLEVLFDPTSKLNDSATYDITAWALPYAYGLQAYGLKENIASQKQNNNAVITEAFNKNAYGYAVPYRSLNDAKLLAALLAEDVKLRVAEAPFTYSGIKYEAGSFVILRKGNENKTALIENARNEFHSTVTPVSSGFMDAGFDFGSDKLHLIKSPAIAIVTGRSAAQNAAGELWHFFDTQLKYPVSMINADDLPNTDLKDYNVLIIPDGSYKFLSSKDDASEIKSWVRAGGKLIVLENAAKQVSELDWGFKLKKAPEVKEDTATMYDNVRMYADREKESVTNNIPGAIYKMQLDNTHPIGFGYPDFYYTLKLNDNVYEFLKDGWNVGVIKRTKPVSGFVGSKLQQTLKDGTLIGELPMGKGSVTFFADDPLFRSFWENGKMLFCNAVFY
jgi:hypothetical protein